MAGSAVKRGGRLVRRTPLRSGGPLHQGRSGLSRTPLRAVSKARAAENRRRSTMAHTVFGDNPACARCGRPADDLHELLSRARGGSITDPDNCVPLCRRCHDDVTFRHHVIPDAARWVRSSGGAA